MTPILLDGFDAKKPQYFDLFYVLDADQGKAVWASSTAPDEELLSLLFPQGVEEKTIPGFIINSTMRVASAPLTPLPAPTVEVIKDMVTSDVRTMHLRFSSQREANILYATVTNPNLIFQSVTVNGIVSAKPLNQSQLNEGKLILPEGASLSDVMRRRTLFYFEGLGAGEVIDVVFEVIVGELRAGLPARENDRRAKGREREQVGFHGPHPRPPACQLACHGTPRRAAEAIPSAGPPRG